MDSLDDSYLLTGYEPKSYELMETYVESFTESLTHPQFSEQGFLEDGDYDDTALEEMLHNAHRVHVYHSRREGLSVGQSCQARINRHEFQAAYDRRSLLKLGEIVESQREELHCARAEEVQQRDQQLLQGQVIAAKFGIT